MKAPQNVAGWGTPTALTWNIASAASACWQMGLGLTASQHPRPNPEDQRHTATPTARVTCLQNISPPTLNFLWDSKSFQGRLPLQMAGDLTSRTLGIASNLLSPPPISASSTNAAYEGFSILVLSVSDEISWSLWRHGHPTTTRQQILNRACWKAAAKQAFRDVTWSRDILMTPSDDAFMDGDSASLVKFGFINVYGHKLKCDTFFLHDHNQTWQYISISRYYMSDHVLLHIWPDQEFEHEHAKCTLIYLRTFC